MDNILVNDKILNGKAVAEYIKANIKEEVDDLGKRHIIPALAIVRVGESSDDIAYENAIIRFCVEVGVSVVIRTFPLNVDKADFVKVLMELNNNKEIHGIMVFRPLPEHLEVNLLKQVIDPQKDIDFLSTINIARLFEGNADGLLPCTPAAVLEILHFYGIKLEGKHVAVLGRSMVVGKPLSMMLLNENATVTVCHSKTQNKEAVIRQADIVISAIGRSKYVNSSFIKEGAIVIDVGINVDSAGNMTGDVDYEDVLNKVGAITPVPGGVGSVTTSVLIKNLVKAAKKQIRV